MGKTIGIIGGGQLGMMLAEEIRALGGRTVCLDPSPDAPAFAVASLLALRGYIGGGSLCPKFKTARSDLLPATVAILIGLLVIVPVRDVFILLQ